MDGKVQSMLETILTINAQKYQVDLTKPLDISMPLKNGLNNANCFYAPPVEFSPVVFGDFVGSTKAGGAVNFMNVRFNPHGNGTHTECVGHISKATFSIQECLNRFFFFAKLVSLFPIKQENGDRMIEGHQIEAVLQPSTVEALIIRTQPNDELKLSMNYSGANPCYIDHKAIEYMVDCGVKHLLIDLPSVDREEDGGQLLGHRAFWKYPDAIRTNCTITELIYARNTIKDGIYLLNLQIATFDLDVSPSKPILYALMPINK